MDLFHRKGDPAELERAAENFNEMLGQVDALGDMIAEARGKQPAPACASEFVSNPRSGS